MGHIVSIFFRRSAVFQENIPLCGSDGEVLQIDDIAVTVQAVGPDDRPVALGPEGQCAGDRIGLRPRHGAGILQRGIIHDKAAAVYDSIGREHDLQRVLMFRGICSDIAILQGKPVGNLHRRDIPVIIFKIGRILSVLKIIIQVIRCDLYLDDRRRDLLAGLGGLRGSRLLLRACAEE